MRAYADTNILSQFYLAPEEPGTFQQLLTKLEKEGSPPLPVTWLHQIEFINSLELHVFWGKSHGRPRVTAEQAAIARASFTSDLSDGSFIARAEIAKADLQRGCEELSLRHTATHGFRAYDVLHVASAILFECEVFWSFDAKASKLARLEGLDAPLA